MFIAISSTHDSGLDYRLWPDQDLIWTSIDLAGNAEEVICPNQLDEISSISAQLNDLAGPAGNSMRMSGIVNALDRDKYINVETGSWVLRKRSPMDRLCTSNETAVVDTVQWGALIVWAGRDGNNNPCIFPRGASSFSEWFKDQQLIPPSLVASDLQDPDQWGQVWSQLMDVDN